MWLLFDSMLKLTLGLLVSAWVARYLGPSQYGEWNYAMAIITLLNVIPYFGLDQVVIKYLVGKDFIEQSKVLSSSFFIRFFWSFLLSSSILVFYIFTDAPLPQYSLLVIMGVSYLFQPFYIIDVYFQSLVQSKYSVYAKSIGYALSSLLKVLMIYAGLGLEWFGVAYSAEFLITAIFFLYFFKKREVRIALRFFDLPISRVLAKQSFPLMATSLSAWVYLKIDQIMLQKMIDSEALGYYSAAVRMSEATYFIPVIIISTFFPELVSIYAKDENLFREKFKALSSTLIYMSVFIASVMVFLSPLFVALLFGDQYNESIPLMQVHFWSLVFVAIGGLMSKYYVLHNLQKFHFLNTSVGGVINVALNFFIIPKLEGFGAAITTLISYSITTVFMVFLFKETRKFGFLIVRSIIFPKMYINPKKK